MQLSELRTKVVNIIQDESFTSDDIDGYLNEVQQEVAGGIQSSLGSWITPPLPALLTIDTITTETDVAYVDMPATFQRNLQFVASSDGNEIDIAESFISFVETYPLLDKSGTVTECCEFGNLFYYQGIPTSAATITLHFYRFPVDMEDDTDEPDGIPSHLHRGLLVNGACWKIFELIEDSTDGNKPNTEKYMNLFLSATRTLELTIPYENRTLNLR
jgi:hypothetical protein